jgi:hypothetical protein
LPQVERRTQRAFSGGRKEWQVSTFRGGFKIFFWSVLQNLLNCAPHIPPHPKTVRVQIAFIKQAIAMGICQFMLPVLLPTSAVLARTQF